MLMNRLSSQARQRAEISSFNCGQIESIMPEFSALYLTLMAQRQAKL